MRDLLAQVGDIERLASRAVLETLTPREAATLRSGLERLPAVVELLSAVESPALQEVHGTDVVTDLAAELVSSKRLDSFGELYLLDQLVKMYPAYKHDDFFSMSVGEVYTYKLMNMVEASINNQKHKVRQQQSKAKKKR